MKKVIFPSAILASLALLAACSGSENQIDNNVVDIFGAISAPTELKVSDLGSKITYVPLETTDSSLISNEWVLRPTDSKLFVINHSGGGLSSENCMAFDSDGKFIATIGHNGQDPEAYSTPFPLISADSNKLYFAGYSGRGAFEQVYSIDGKYLGRVFPKMPPLGNPASSILIDTVILTVDAPCLNDIQYFTVYSGGLNSDTVTSFSTRPLPENTDRSMYFDNVSIYSVKGVMRNPIAQYNEYVEEGGSRRHLFNPQRTMSAIWKVGDCIHYHLALTDTIFAITPESVDVAYTFNCGPGAISHQEINKNGIKSSNVIVTDLCETPDKIVFGASKGWMRDENHEPFVGYFDKKTGKTVATSAKEGFIDDLTGFMPFYPVLATENGKLIGILTMDDIAEWTDAHPDTELPEPLRNLADDANPIVVIVSQ